MATKDKDETKNEGKEVGVFGDHGEEVPVEEAKEETTTEEEGTTIGPVGLENEARKQEKK